MTISKILLTNTMAFSAMVMMGCSANSAETAVQSVDEAYNSSQDYSKPGAAVNYAYNLKSQLSAGENVTFTLTLSEAYNAGNLVVNLGVDGGIVLFPTSTKASFDMAAGNSHDMNVSFTANANGRHYINVQAEAIDGAGNAMPRIFSIPVQVGPPAAKKPHPNMETTATGDKVISMEAEEEIIFK